MKKSILYIIIISLFNLLFLGNILAKESTIRVLIGDTTNVKITAQNDFVMKVPELEKIYRFPKGKILDFSLKNNEINLNNKDLKAKDIIIAVKDRGLVSVNGNPFRGALNIVHSGNKILIINQLPLEEYLYSVVASEMPPAWHMEALKSQSVAARSFSLNYKNKNTNSLYDICSTTKCQVYKGVNTESPNSTKAVKETFGLVMTYDKQPISAQFHAASGGSTENSEDVWGGKAPYLRAVLDEKEVSPYSHWQKEYDQGTFTKIIKKAIPNISTIVKVDVSRYPKNKITNYKKEIILIDDANKKYTINGTTLRDLFNLNSTNFTIEIVGQTKEKINPPKDKIANKKINPKDIKKDLKTSPKEAIEGKIASSKNLPLKKIAAAKKEMDKNKDIKFIITGSGYGHRIGMSQWGAKKEAERGKNFREILHKYYTDVEIVKLY